jgi:hypothetical protein
MDYMGTNGDGTSGPSWNKVPQAEKKAKRPEFDKYKKIDVELSVIINTNDKDDTSETDPTVLTIPTDDYTIEFSKRGKKSWYIRLPKIKLSWKRKIKKRMRKINYRTLKCTFFD